eukprot:2998583-Pyramimonas_sp.AAC.1
MLTTPPPFRTGSWLLTRLVRGMLPDACRRTRTGAPGPLCARRARGAHSARGGARGSPGAWGVRGTAGGPG